MNSVKDDENSLLVTIVLLRASLNDQKTRSNQLRKCELMGQYRLDVGGKKIIFKLLQPKYCFS